MRANRLKDEASPNRRLDGSVATARPAGFRAVAERHSMAVGVVAFLIVAAIASSIFGVDVFAIVDSLEALAFLAAVLTVAVLLVGRAVAWLWSRLSR